MPTPIDKQRVIELLKTGAQHVDVLPQSSYRERHIPDAISLPLVEMTAKSTATLSHRQPIIVYCNDIYCDLSPRAAARLESLGFVEIYDYTKGLMDWFGEEPDPPAASSITSGDAVRRDVPTADLTEPLADARNRTRRAGWDRCVVINADRVVLGLIEESHLGGKGSESVEAVMRNGPGTNRDDIPLSEALDIIKTNAKGTLLITTKEGVLVGVLTKGRAERLLTEAKVAG